MSDRHYYPVERDDSEQAWAPSMPLVVIEYCLDPKKSHGQALLCTWLGLHWLISAYPKRRGFGRREIAARSRVSPGRVYDYLQELVQVGLVEETERRGDGNLYYKIPLRQLTSRSAELLPEVQTRWRVPATSREPSPEQTMLPLDDQLIPGDHDDPRGSQKGRFLIPGDHDDPRGSQKQGFLIPGDQFEAKPSLMVLNERTEGRKESRKEGSPAFLAQRVGETGAAPPVEGAPPEVPPGEAPLDYGPYDLAAQLLGRELSSAEEQKLNTLIRKHNRAKGAYTGGYGAFWVAQAIEEANLAEPIAEKETWISYVISVLLRWRGETTEQLNAYGSDRPRRERAPRPRAPEPQQTPAPAPRLPAPDPQPQLVQPEPEQLQQLQPSAPIGAIDGEPEQLNQVDQVEDELTPETILQELRRKLPLQRQIIDQITISASGGKIIVGYPSAKLQNDVARVLPMIRSLYTTRGITPPQLFPLQRRT